jgi:hypothetical protein
MNCARPRDVGGKAWAIWCQERRSHGQDWRRFVDVGVDFQTTRSGLRMSSGRGFNRSAGAFLHDRKPREQRQYREAEVKFHATRHCQHRGHGVPLLYRSKDRRRSTAAGRQANADSGGTKSSGNVANVERDAGEGLGKLKLGNLGRELR